MKVPKIEFVSKIQGTNVLPFVIDAYVALRKTGDIEPNDVPASGTEEAFYIKVRGRIVSVLCFYESDEGEITVTMGFVLAPYRKRGHYSLLWSRLVQDSISRGVKSILGYHKPCNARILSFNDKVGRRIKFICSEYTVPAKNG